MMIEEKNTKTGATRWVQAPDTRNFSQKVNDIPIVGPVLSTLTTLAGAKAAPVVTNSYKMSSAALNKSMDLLDQAKKETDPVKRQQLADEARKIREDVANAKVGIDRASDMTQQTNVFQGKNMEGANKLLEYGKQGLKTGQSAGEIYSTASIIKGGVQATKGGINYVKRAAGVKGSIIDKLKALEPSVNWGEQAKTISSEATKKVEPKKILSSAADYINKNSIGSTKEKALVELNKLAKDAPRNIFDALMDRRTADKMIVRNLFGVAKSNSGKNVAINAYRTALSDVVKAIPELANIDKKLSFYYNIKDPVVNLVTNRLVQAGGLGVGLSKLLK